MRLIVEATRNGKGGYTLQCLEYPGAITEVIDLSEVAEIIEPIAFVSGIDESEIEFALMIDGKVLEFA